MIRLERDSILDVARLGSKGGSHREPPPAHKKTPAIAGEEMILPLDPAGRYILQDVDLHADSSIGDNSVQPTCDNCGRMSERPETADEEMRADGP